MPGGARALTDYLKHDGPHCHAPIHPAAPVPTPVPHPCMNHQLVKGAATVLINKMPAVRVTDMSLPCLETPCIPAGPGIVAMGSFTVIIEAMPAARKGDLAAFPSCVAPIPSPTGTVFTGSDDVDIGG